MKITKYSKFITASISNSYLADDILFDDVIRVDIEFDFDCIRNYIQSSHQFDKFPGKEQFRQDVINLLEEKYFFDVIEDNYDGKLQKGHFSNREDSISLYIDAYLDLNIPLKETPILMKHYRNRLLAVISPSAQVYLPLGGSFHYQTEYLKDIIYKLNLLYIFWSNNIPIKIKYKAPDIGYQNPLINLE